MKACRTAAEQEHPGAEHSLGIMYRKGMGVPQDYTEAVRWSRRAAEQGHPVAQYNLGIIYYKGMGVPQDYAEAVRWLRRAAEQEHPGAQKYLGLIYDEGRGVPQASPAVAKQPGKGSTCDRLFSLAVTRINESGEKLVKVYKDTKELKEVADLLNDGEFHQKKLVFCHLQAAAYGGLVRTEDWDDKSAVVCRLRIDEKDKVLRVCRGTILSASRGKRRVLVVSQRDVDGDEYFTYSDFFRPSP